MKNTSLEYNRLAILCLNLHIPEKRVLLDINKMNAVFTVFGIAFHNQSFVATIQTAALGLQVEGMPFALAVVPDALPPDGLLVVTV